MRLIFVCNDRVVTRAVRFLQSVRENACLSPAMIPFDDNITLSSQVAAAFGVPIIREGLDQIDEFGKEFFAGNVPQEPFPYMLGKLRKLSMFCFSEPCLYMDVDTIITSDFTDIVRFLTSENYTFAYFVKSKDWVYNDSPLGRTLAARSQLFSSGFLAKGAIKMTLSEVLRQLLLRKNEYHGVRVSGVVDQPLLNFISDQIVFGTSINLQTGLGLSSAVNPSDETITDSAWRISSHSKTIPFLHAAGSFKTDRRCRFLFDGMFIDGLKHIRKTNKRLSLELFDHDA